MKHPTLQSSQRGISLVMALVMLVILTMTAISATYSTNSSIRIAGNMQAQDEGLMAAQMAIDDQLSSLNNFTTPASRTVSVDINKDGVTDYNVALAAPVCMSTTPMPGYSSSIASSAPNTTFWEVRATVTDTRTGASSVIYQGVKIAILPYQGC